MVGLYRILEIAERVAGEPTATLAAAGVTEVMAEVVTVAVAAVAAAAAIESDYIDCSTVHLPMDSCKACTV